jgi:dienelactone hydrolase
MDVFSRRELPLRIAGPAALMAAAQGAEETPPSLGNLYAPIERYGSTLSPSHSFLEPRFKDFDAWKREAREIYRARLGYWPKVGSVQARTVSRRQRNGYAQEDIEIQLSPFATAPAVLLIPEKPLKNRPALVALHDHGGFYYFGKEKLIEMDDELAILTEFKRKLYSGRSFASEFARAGYVVLVIDAFYFGTRRLLPETLPAGKAKTLDGLKRGSDAYIAASNRIASAYEDLTAKTIFLSGATWPGMITFDDVRSVDYLLTRPEVNRERIGCVGLSLGGLRAAMLCGMHPAVRSSVVCCWMSAFKPMLRNDVEHHTWMLYNAAALELMDEADVASMTAPNWLLVQYGKQDTLFPMAGKTESAEKLKNIFAKAKAAEKFKASFWDEPHSFPKGMQDEAMEWFGRTLA